MSLQPGSGRPRALLLVSELEDYTLSFVNGLSAHADVLLCVPRRRYASLAGEFAAGVDLRLLEWPRHRSLANPAFLSSLLRLVHDERPDVIHLLSNNVLWLNLCLPFWRGVPILTTIHDIETHPGDADTRTVPDWSRRLAARQSPDLVVHGESLRQRAIDRFGKPPDRVHAIPHPAIPRYAALARRQGLVRAAAGFTVLMFGRIFAYKGLADLVRAEGLIGADMPDLRLVIAGRGDDPRSLRGEMGDPSRYDIRNRFIEDGEVAQLFVDADLVVLPYTEASQSGVLNIAATFGKPVLATDVGELGATVRCNGLGRVVPPRDPMALAQGIRDFARDPGLGAACGRAATAWAAGPNHPDAVGALAADLYRRLRVPAAGYPDRTVTEGAPMAQTR